MTEWLPLIVFISCFTIWLAGWGFIAGIDYGKGTPYINDDTMILGMFWPLIAVFLIATAPIWIAFIIGDKVGRNGSTR